ncbi:HNH endonuclease, partial [Psychromonas sp. MB-3u-54]|uniref:HNH endonuclease n=1 Tax=Psychromonas sp. MB-3u-54 TaxID=2058319 RepID=UPI000CAC1D10
KLHVHHVIFRSKDGTDTPGNLKVLCETCHNDLHAGKFELIAKKSTTKHATEVGIVKTQLSKRWIFEETFGFETKFKR